MCSFLGGGTSFTQYSSSEIYSCYCCMNHILTVCTLPVNGYTTLFAHSHVEGRLGSFQFPVITLSVTQSCWSTHKYAFV